MLQHAVEKLKTQRAVELVLGIFLLLLKDVETLIISGICEAMFVVWEEVVKSRVLCNDDPRQ